MSHHAYLIAAYENYDVLEHLMQLVDDERNEIFLHVDKKARSFDSERFSSVCSHSHVTIVPRMNVYWADYTQVKSAIALMRIALSANTKFDYLHFLSDSDLPIKTQDEIHNFVTTNAGKEFVAFNPPPQWADEWPSFFYPLNRYLRSRSSLGRKAYKYFRHWSLAMQRRAHIHRTRPIEIKYGSDYFSITRALAEYVVAHEHEIHQLFRRTFLPSEFYIQTLVWNSPFKERVYDLSDPYRSNLRHIDFRRGTGASPHTYTIHDLDELLDSDRLFARKFSTNVDKTVIETLSARLI